MSKELDIGKECCNIWNKLKDKTKVIDYLIESKKQVADLETELAEYKKQLPINDDKHARRNPPKAVEVLKKYINLIEGIYYYTVKYIDDTEIPLEETFDKLLDQLDELLERKEKEMKSE